ncbi:DUF6770 family protein [Chitinophaga tropicalis]|uniref:Uncharacterized protein n=1 Tax=Chitinophaga tropicalis TaxID=2683588 RepID=A0A7K1U7I5_9BACT|nr:DUF6770 family protein [Chitinophaga tropicalis]MVT10307.1 hypothetical protein [Chitinophaga tropicalis]
MIRKFVAALFLFGAIITGTNAQQKLSIDKVYSTYLRNSGSIMENNQLKGYFFLYQSDKIDRKTNEYTLQILDENLNKVQDIKFQDSKDLRLLEASYNGNSMAFYFQNEKENLLTMKVYDLSGKLKFTYSREYDRKTEALMAQYETMHTDEGTNQNVYDISGKGYVSVMPLRDGRNVTYEVDYFSSDAKKQWTFKPLNDDDKYAAAEYLGSTDNLLILQVIRKSKKMSNKMVAHMVAIDLTTKKQVFDLEAGEDDEQMLFPTTVKQIEGSENLLVMGTYYNKGDKAMKDPTRGLAVYQIDPKGNILNRTYNSWAEDFAKYLPTNSKGKIDNIGYLYIHKMLQAPGGKLFVVGEGYKKQASAGGIALTALAAAGGGYGGRGAAGVTKVVVTDMVMMEFDKNYKVTAANIYDKTNNTAEASIISDYLSQHALAVYLKATGAFDYDFTTGEPDNSVFSVCYSDYVRTGDYKGQTFNTIRYNGSKFTKDKIELKSKASTMKVFPAKPGSVMIMEYFKKDKRLEFRLEKIG